MIFPGIRIDIAILSPDIMERLKVVPLPASIVNYSPLSRPLGPDNSL